MGRGADMGVFPPKGHIRSDTRSAQGEDGAVPSSRRNSYQPPNPENPIRPSGDTSTFEVIRLPGQESEVGEMLASKYHVVEYSMSVLPSATQYLEG